VNDAEYEAQRDRFLALSDKWSNRLGLTHWRRTYNFHRAMPCDDAGVHNGTLMSVAPSWQYMTATFNVYLAALIELDDEELARALFHEMAHCFVNEMGEDFTDPVAVAHQERAVSMISHAIYEAYQEGLNEGSARPKRRVRQAVS
jgi:predicted aminopeptidase